MMKNVLLIMNSRLRNVITKGMCNQKKKQNCKPPPVPTTGNQLCYDAPQQATTEQICETPTVAINGFGRIGKCILRLAVKNDLNVIIYNNNNIVIVVLNSINLFTYKTPYFE